MTDIDPSTQIGPDGKRHPTGDIASLSQEKPHFLERGWDTTLLASGTLSANGHSTAIEAGDRTEARLDLAVTAVVGTNEVQTVTLANATGGTFTLTYSGQTTSAIAYNATAATVQAALIALSNIGPSDVVVSGSAGGPYTVTFQGALGSQNVAQLTATSSLTGSSPTVTPATQTPGVAPTLDVTVETATAANGSFSSVGTFAQKTAVGTEHKLFDNLDEFVRVSYVITGGSLTFSVGGELL